MSWIIGTRSGDEEVQRCLSTINGIQKLHQEIATTSSDDKFD